MNWTTELPEVHGEYGYEYYWWRKNAEEFIMCVFLVDTVLHYRVASRHAADKEPVENLGGEWYGPLTPPGDDT